MILLLDIDGVLEISPSWKKPEFLKDNFYKFNQKAQDNFIEIIEEIKPEIILTTSHRINYSLIEWKQIFELRGINITKISKINNVDKISELKKRNIEIQEWYLISKEKDFLIIDDDNSLNELPQEIKKHWIKIDPLLGITEEIKLKILNKIDK